jgi:hypothetical protein
MMKAKVTFLLSILLSGVLLAQHASTQQPAPAKMPSTPAPVFVPLPKDIQCSLQGLSFRSVVGAHGQMENTNGTVDSLNCWIAAKGEGQKTDIPLASNDITHEIIATKDFGKLRMAPQNSVSSAGFSLSIRADRMKALRAFLLSHDTAEVDAQVAARHPTEPIYVAIPDWADCEFSGMYYQSVVGSSSGMNGSLTGMICSINGYGSLPKRDVALLSTSITDGVLKTKDFGFLRVSVFIRQDMVHSFHEFLFQGYSNGEANILAASQYGDLVRVNALLSAHTDVNATDKDGDTPLALASLYGNLDVAKALVTAKADVNVQNFNGGTALTWVSGTYGNPILVRFLVASGADVNLRTKKGYTALILASSWGKDDIVRILLRANANVNAKDNEGDTALIDASANGYVSIVRALIAAKADVNIVRNDGATALSVSLKNEHTDVADLLKKAGAHE